MTQNETFEGPISITKRGMGFVSISPNKEDDLIIEPENVNRALPGDIVRVERAGFLFNPRDKSKRPAGRVLEVVRRNRETFVGTLSRSENTGRILLLPDWKKMHIPLTVQGENLPLGHKVVLRLGGWEEGADLPWGTVEEVIGPAGVHDVEMRALALSQGFHSDFPPSVIQEAHELESTGKERIEAEAQTAVMWGEEAPHGTRRDFRGITTFTIDPFDAKDFDDALSVRTLPNGNYEIGVHIADVSFFVTPGTAIDREAVNRATSVYLVDRTIPMLPEVLSNNYCSLNPNEDRLSMSAVFEMDAQAGIISSWFGQTVIHSDKRFTYEEAQEVLDTQNGPMLEELNTLASLARLLRDRRTKKGAIAFDTPEVKVKLDENGKPIDVVLKERKETNLLIEDFMLLANESVAEYLSVTAKKQNLKASPIFRVHDSPDGDRIEGLSEFLKVMGYNLPVAAGRVKGTDINALLKQVEGKPEEYLIKVATLRSMAKAVYTTKNAGHYGLAFEFYTHFTSPIRRYPDLLIHRMVKHVIGAVPMTLEDMQAFETLAVHSSEREVSAAEAERDSVKLKQVEYLMNRIGEEFDAVISGVADRGLFVELDETRAEGMIPVRSIGQDYFIHDQKRYRLVGERTKVEYALGDPVCVKLVAARPMERELDFELVAKK